MAANAARKDALKGLAALTTVEVAVAVPVLVIFAVITASSIFFENKVFSVKDGF